MVVDAIALLISHLGENYTLRTYNNEYPDLRHLIIDKLDLEDFGQCGGMGRCATCMVQINHKKTASLFNVHLACQTPIDDGLTNTEIEII
jgi:hypothetical protein